MIIIIFITGVILGGLGSMALMSSRLSIDRTAWQLMRYKIPTRDVKRCK